MTFAATRARIRPQIEGTDRGVSGSWPASPAVDTVSRADDGRRQPRPGQFCRCHASGRVATGALTEASQNCPQFRVSAAIDPSVDTNPMPNPTPRPAVVRMNVLDPSSGSVATLRQKAAHLPS